MGPHQTLSWTIVLGKDKLVAWVQQATQNDARSLQKSIGGLGFRLRIWDVGLGLGTRIRVEHHRRCCKKPNRPDSNGISLRVCTTEEI